MYKINVEKIWTATSTLKKMIENEEHAEFVGYAQ